MFLTLIIVSLLAGCESRNVLLIIADDAGLEVVERIC